MSSKVAILVAIVIGIIAAVFIHNYMNRQQLEDDGRYVTVMKISQNIPAGGKLSANNVAPVKIPNYAYSSNMQVTPGIFENYNGKPLKNACYRGQFLTMADLPVEPKAAKKPIVEKGFVLLTVDLVPGRYYELDEGSTVMLVMQDPVRMTSSDDPKMHNAYRYTLVTGLTVMQYGDKRPGSGGSVGHPFVNLKVRTEYAIAIGNAMNQCKNAMIFAYNPEDELIKTDETLFEFYTEHVSCKEVYEKVKQVLNFGEGEE